MKKIISTLSLSALALALGGNAHAISHSASDLVPPVVVSPSFGAVVPGGIVGTAAMIFGVDYSWGGMEGIFNDPPFAIGGVNLSDIIDLVTDVDGRIVVPGSLTQGTTNSITVEAGNSAVGSLTLSVYDTNGLLIDTALNGLPLGLNARTTMSIAAEGIAFFRVSGSDTYGVTYVELGDIDGDSGAAVPDSGSTAILVGLGILSLAAFRRKLL